MVAKVQVARRTSLRGVLNFAKACFHGKFLQFGFVVVPCKPEPEGAADLKQKQVSPQPKHATKTIKVFKLGRLDGRCNLYSLQGKTLDPKSETLNLNL